MPSTITDRLNGLTTSVAVKAPCRAATTGNVTLSGAQTIDGVALTSGDRVLVKNQTTTTENGIYVVASGAWVRAADFDGSLDAVGGTEIPVVLGTTNANTYWKVSGSSTTLVVGTDAITFTPGGLAGINAIVGQTIAANLVGITGATGQFAWMAGYHSAGDGGGGYFAWEGSTSKVLHNGGTIIDPSRSFPSDWTNQTQLDTWFAAGVSGTGVWRRVGDTSIGSPRWYGVKADYNPATGSGTDDCRAINKCITLHRTVQFPEGNMLVRSQGVNIANRSGHGGCLRGVAGTKISGGYAGSVIWGETGVYPAVDLSGSQGVRVEELAIVSGVNTPSKCGLLVMRTTVSQYAQFNVCRDLFIDIATAPTAYTNRGSVGLLNLAGELFKLENSYILGDTGVEFSYNNPRGVASQFYIYDSSLTSTSSFIASQVSAHSYNVVGAPVVLRNAGVVRGEFYTTCTLSAGSPVAGSHGFRCYGLLHASKIHFYPEGCERVGLVDFLDGCELTISTIFSAGKRLVSAGTFATRDNSIIRFDGSAAGSAAQTYWVEDSAGDVWRNCTIIAPLAPSTAFVAAAVGNQSDCEFFAVDRRRRLTGSTTTDVASIANNAQASFDVTVTGVTVAGAWHCTVTCSADPGALGISAIVRANDTVRVTLVNNSGGAIDPASLTYTVIAQRL